MEGKKGRKEKKKHESYLEEYSCCSFLATFSRVDITVSGFRDMESIPHSTKNSANSGKSEGAWPHIPTFLLGI